jgi:hypothetical protein
MADVSALQQSIDARMNELYPEAAKYMDKLLTSARSISGGGAANNIDKLAVPTVSNITPLVINTKDLIDVSSLFEPVTSLTNTFKGKVNSTTLQLNSFITKDPISGWIGVVPFDKWSNMKPILDSTYNDPLIDIAKQLVNELEAQTNVEAVKNYLYATIDKTFLVCYDIINGNRYNKRLFVVPSVINQSISNTITTTIGFENDTNIKLVAYMLEYLAVEIKGQALKLKVELDKVLPKAAIIYGEVYAIMADYISTKANREVEWFFKDYEAATKAYSANTQMNFEHYLSFIQDQIETMTKSIDLNIKAIITDSGNILKQLTNAVDLQKVDLDLYGAYNEASLAVYGMRLNDKIGLSSSSNAIDLADKTNKLASYTSLLGSYYSQIVALTQDVIGVATSSS